MPDYVGIAMAALGGAVVGVERQWSGHAEAHFAGIRTFTLLGGIAGAAGWLWTLGLQIPAIIMLIGAVAMIVAAYVATSRHEIDATTEVAALVVLAAGLISGIGYWELSSAIVIVTAVLLIEKSRLHSMVKRLPDEGLRAGFRFALMAIVILPLLPEGPYGPWGGVRPRELWMLVLLFSGISFLAYIARAFVGQRQGYLVAGVLGGLISSTNVAFSFSRMREKDALQTPLALGVVGASTMLYLRITVAAGILNPALGLALLPLTLPPLAVGVLFCAVGLKRFHVAQADVGETPNPLQLKSSMQMAALFQAVLFLVYLVREHWGQAGLIGAGAVLGLTDVDALVISMAKSASQPEMIATAALATATGIVANKVVKLGAVLIFGRGRFRWLAASGMILLAAATGAAIAFSR